MERTGFYVVVTKNDGREERTATFSDRGYAVSFAKILRDADESLRRVDVCRHTGMIVKGWDRDATGKWSRTV